MDTYVFAHTHMLAAGVICHASRACLSVNQEALVLAASKDIGKSEYHKPAVSPFFLRMSVCSNNTQEELAGSNADLGSTTTGNPKPCLHQKREK